MIKLAERVHSGITLKDFEGAVGQPRGLALDLKWKSPYFDVSYLRSLCSPSPLSISISSYLHSVQSVLEGSIRVHYRR